MKFKSVRLNENFLNIPIAHRGLHTNTVSENSLEAFRLAKNSKTAIEIDVYRLKDGEFAVFHDKNMKRMTGQDVSISSLSSTDLLNIRLFDNQKIPMLKEVFDLVNGEVPLLIELKPEDGFYKNDIADLLKLIDEYNHPEMIAIQTFNPLIVREVKKLTDKYPVGILSSYDLKNIKGIKNYIAKSLLLFIYIHADFVSYDIKYLPNKYVQKFKKKGVPVLAWVVDTKEKLEVSKIVADNIIFEKIEILDNYGK